VKVLLGAWPWRARQETDRSRSRPTCSRAAWRGCARCGPPIASHRCAGATTGTSATTFSATAFRSPRRWKRIGSAWFARNAEFGLLIGERNRHGKGLAKEALALVAGYAFETLNLHKLYLRVVAFNKRALVLYVRLRGGRCPAPAGVPTRTLLRRCADGPDPQPRTPSDLTPATIDTRYACESRGRA
jgi:hypothetical protein